MSITELQYDRGHVYHTYGMITVPGMINDSESLTCVYQYHIMYTKSCLLQCLTRPGHLVLPNVERHAMAKVYHV